MKPRVALLLPLLAVAAIGGQPVSAQETDATPAEAAQQMAKDLSNPISSMISVPFQENIDFDVGPNEGVKHTLNFQPVVPFALNGDLNLIVRTIVPIIHQDDVLARSSKQFGLGDTTQSFFFSPSRPTAGGIIWGAGPVFLYPTGTSSSLGSEKWGAGLTVVALKQSGPNTFGILANHIWSIGGDESRPDISSTFLQPFFAHTTPKALTISLNAESSYDWKAEQWIVPINATVTQLTHIGRQPISVGGGLRYYVETPAAGPDWGVRFIATLLFR